MNDEQKQAYDWAKSHYYPSIAARYARSLATAVDDLQSQLAESQRRERAAENQVCKSCEAIALMNGVRHTCLEKCEWRGPQEAGKGEAR